MINTKIVIPARYGSSRLPGKPLRSIAGKTMIEHVYQRAVEADASEVVVATDDTRIVTTVESFGGQAIMTSSQHASGTDRLAEVVQRMNWSDDTIVVNLQGDEPLMDPLLLKSVAEDLAQHSSAGISTLAMPLATRETLFDPNIVKVVMDNKGMALYFSRAPIPWVRDDFMDNNNSTGGLPVEVPFFHHLGVYAYRVHVLHSFPSLEPCALEQAEALEQNRALFHGIKIHLSVKSTVRGHGVDTESDLRRVEAILNSAKR